MARECMRREIGKFSNRLTTGSTGSGAESDIHDFFVLICLLHRFDAVGWAAGRESGL